MKDIVILVPDELIVLHPMWQEMFPEHVEAAQKRLEVGKSLDRSLAQPMESGK